MTPISGIAAGVPFLAVPPATDVPAQEYLAPVVVWHMMDPPRSELAMAAALPLQGLPAWRIYLGLPMLGSRLPEGGLDAFLHLGYEDAILRMIEPVVQQAVDEFPAALAELRARLSLGDGPVALIGGSVSTLIPQRVATETDLSLSALVLISPVIQLAATITANSRRFGVAYPWSERSRAIARRMDFVARADELAKRNAAVLLVVGAQDDQEGFHQPAKALWQALSEHAPDRTSLTEVPQMGHALAEEPGLAPAPQTATATRVDALVTDWLRRHLHHCTS